MRVGWPTSLRALGVQNYRRFILAQVFANGGMWIHRTAHVWLVVELAGGDPVAVGVVTSLQYLPMIPLSLVGGALGDRFDKRTLMLITQCVVLVASAVIGVLILRGAMTVGLAYLFACLLGIPAALDAPVRLAYPRKLVPRELLAPAVGLNGAVFQLARVVGPAVTGGLIATRGTAVAFLVVTALSLGSFIAHVRVHGIRDLPVACADCGPSQRALAAVRRPAYLVPLLGALLVGIGITNVQLVVPLVVAQQGQAAGGMFGVLLAAIGLGGVAGAGLAASLRSEATNRSLLLAALIFSAACLAFAAVPRGPVMAVSLVFIGAAMQLYGTMAIAALQLRSPSHLQSTMMSLYVIAFFVWTPVGAPLFGWVAGVLGPREALAAASAVCLVGVGWMALLARSGLREGKPEPTVGQ